MPRRVLRFTLAILVCLTSSRAQVGTSDARTDTRIDINSASVSELQQLPGVSLEIARKLVLKRPYTKASDLRAAGLSKGAIGKLAPLIKTEPVQRETPGSQGGTVAAGTLIQVPSEGASRPHAVLVSDKAPVLSDTAKKRRAEIEQLPEVQDAVREAWDQLRRKDLDYAYAINSSPRFVNASFQQALDLRNQYGVLYENPIIQRYLNSIGQRLVPRDSPNLYAFRILLDPLPRAEALATGTIYISTGLVALLDDEAQLSYVLAHEIAHVEKNHQYQDIRNAVVNQRLEQDQAKDAARRKGILLAATTIGGGLMGGVSGDAAGAVLGSALGVASGLLASQYLFHGKAVQWTTNEEDEADSAALSYMLAQSYDPRELPRMFGRMMASTVRDSRVGLGFMANPSRLKLRTSHLQDLLSGTAKEQLAARLGAGGLIASTPEFAQVMASLKRDNGIVALDYDMFPMSRENLEEAVALRSNDSQAQLYLGKVIALTARTAVDREQAMGHFLKAIQYDAARGAYPDSHLERAVDLIAQNNPAQQDEIRKELQVYIALYQRENKGSLPSNMPVIFDYMQLAGDPSWYVGPATVVSTKYGEALQTSPSRNPAPETVKDVVENATLPPAAQVNTSPSPRNSQKIKKVTTTSPPQ